MKKLTLLLLTLALVLIAAPSISKADDSCYYDGYSFYYGTVTVTDAKGKVVKFNEYVPNGTELTAKVDLKNGYKWDDSEDADVPVFYVQGNAIELDTESETFKFTVNSSWADYFYISNDAYPVALPHYEYYHGNGYTMTAKDSKGNTVEEGDLLTDGQKLTVTVTLDEGYEWSVDKPYFYAHDNYYELDKKGSFTFTYDSSYETTAYIYTYAEPQHIYTAKITADEHVKSFLFPNSPDKKDAAAAVGEKEYLLDRAHGLSGESIAIKCVFEDGYELSSVKVTRKAIDTTTNQKVNVGKASFGGSSDLQLITVYPDSGLYYYMTSDDYELDIKIKTKKVTKKNTITLDPDKYYIATPKVSKDKWNRQYNYYGSSDYYRKTKTLTFGKGKKAKTVFNIEMERYGKKGDVYVWLDYNEPIKFGTDAAKYEIFDFSGVTELDIYTVRNIVNEIYSEYKKGRLPALKAIFLPKDIVIDIRYNYEDDGEFYYYPIQVLTAE